MSELDGARVVVRPPELDGESVVVTVTQTRGAWARTVSDVGSVAWYPVRMLRMLRGSSVDLLR